jgi:hypothetical protein
MGGSTASRVSCQLVGTSGGASYGRPSPSRVLGVTTRTMTVLISGRLRPETKVVLIPGLRDILMFAGGSAQAIVNSTATRGLPDP